MSSIVHVVVHVHVHIHMYVHAHSFTCTSIHFFTLMQCGAYSAVTYMIHVHVQEKQKFTIK